MKGASKKRLCKKFLKSELYDVTRDEEDGITELDILIGNLWKLGFIIEHVQMVTLILSNLPEEYENTVENLEEKLDDDIHMLTIKIIWCNISPKKNRTNVWYNQTKWKDSEKVLYVHQKKGKWYKCGKYGHKTRYFMRRK